MRCKPGDLAFIVRDDDNPSDIGKIVEILRICPADEWLNSSEPEWECISRTPLKGFHYTSFLEPGVPGECLKADIPDSCLRPISGVPVNDETPIETNVPEAVKLAWGIEAPVLA